MDPEYTMARIAASEFARFIGVGFSNFLVSYGTFLGLVALFPRSSYSAGLAQAISYSAGIAWSYYWNRRWTFSVRDPQTGAFTRFVIWQLALMVISSFLIGTLAGQSKILPWMIWLLVMGPITVLNFVGTRCFVFRRSTARSNASAVSAHAKL
jgi:putative flippase GtrA